MYKQERKGVKNQKPLDLGDKGDRAALPLDLKNSGWGGDWFGAFVLNHKGR